MSQVVAFMYHALYEDEHEWKNIPVEERPYAISVSDFTEQLIALADNNIPVIDPVSLSKKLLSESRSGVVLTFDDGHESFYKHAYKILKENGVRAIFFITSDLIEQRKDFCSWKQLSEMASDGFLIQAHGKTHRFFSELDGNDLVSEFEIPKKIIEKNTGENVYSVSFPGGRYKQTDLLKGKELGYSLFYTSDVASISIGGFQCSGLVNRIAIRENISLKTYIQLAKAKNSVLIPRMILFKFKVIIKMLLGNNLYHVLYKKIFS